MWAGVVPQQPPTTAAPSARTRTAWRPAPSGVMSQTGTPPSRRGTPAFPFATRTAPGTASRMAAIAVSISSGPLPQFAPIAATPSVDRVVAAAAGVVPIIVRPWLSNVIVTTIGRPGATCRTASTAAVASSSEAIVSIQMASTPPSARPFACTANAARASCDSIVPNGASSSPRGPMEPATIPCLPAASRAIPAAARLSSPLRSASPWVRSRTGLPPNVFVRTIRAPARM